jgi:hypothetical protein
MPQATYATLRTILLELGFTETVIPKSRIWFEHSDPPARILLPFFQADEQVDVENLVIVRHTLDARGLMTREEFDRLLAERAVAV